MLQPRQVNANRKAAHLRSWSRSIPTVIAVSARNASGETPPTEAVHTMSTSL